MSITQTTFLRYGIGALRRGYAVVMVRQPGQAGEGVVNASQPLIYDYTNLTISVLDTIRANATLASKVDLNNVTLMSVALASYGTARACASLPDRLQACVLNSPMYDVAAIIGSAVARLMLSPMALAANSTPNALPSEDMVRWLSVHAVGTAIGTHICVAGGRPQEPRIGDDNTADQLQRKQWRAASVWYAVQGAWH